MTSSDQSPASFNAWVLLPTLAALALAIGGGLFGSGQMPLSGFVAWALMTLAAVAAGSVAALRHNASDARGVSAEHLADLEGQVAAINRSQAVIEFDLDGTIRHANDNFLSAVGYRLDEIVGKHHRIFVDPDDAASPEYSAFWTHLGRGQFDAGQYRRIGKDGSEIWIQASYNPVFDSAGNPLKVVKYATDITAQVQANAAVEDAVHQTNTVVAAARAGDMSARIDTSGAHGPIGELCEGINQMLDDIAASQRQMEEVGRTNLRIKNALDNVTTNVMIADNDRQITYMNESVQGMLREAESDIQKELPGFRVDGLLGGNIDAFHKNPEHQIKMLEALKQPHRANICLGGRTFGLIASPVIDQDGTRLGTVVEWQDRTAELKMQSELDAKAEQERKVAAENMQIRNALDNVSGNVMIANAERTITYMNAAVVGMLRRNQEELRKVLPSFNVDNLIGNSIDQFHRNPAHQAGMLANLRETYRTQIKVGPLSFGLIASPIMTESGEHAGTVVEWIDRTAEVAVEEEIGNIVAASSRGEFDDRVSLDGKTGFFESLAKGINQLLDTCQVGFNDVIRVLSALAQGDLTQRMDAEYSGTFAELKVNLNQTIDSLGEMVVAIKSASDDINSAASDISAGSEDLSSRTEEQAASLEETASSMEELTSTVKQNADNAKQANQLAIGASDVATKGGSVVGDVVTRMAEITEASKKIEDIISVIEGIAFQTNILALNAAVEAARAGEQGRGFAVVASEVRSLAQRSSGAAKEIKALISNSVERIEDGSKLVEQAGVTMQEIVTAVKRVTDIMAEISAASQEQSSGIEQINQTIAQMDDATQQNAALVEQSSASAKSMLDQGGELASQVARFRISAEDAERAIVVSEPARPAPRTEATAPKVHAQVVQRQRGAREERAPAASVPLPKASEADEHWTEF